MNVYGKSYSNRIGEMALVLHDEQNLIRSLNSSGVTLLTETEMNIEFHQEWNKN